MQSTVLSTERFDVYAAITDKIVSAIEAGAGKFVMPWHRLSPALGRPTNAATNLRYQGINVVALWVEAVTTGYASGRWATYRQWLALGAQVRRGEHGATVVFYKRRESDEDDEGEGPVRLLARAFRVFNEDQVTGWAPTAMDPLEPLVGIESADEFVRRTCARIQHGGDVACYRPRDDLISMPVREQFVGSPSSTATEAYYSTLLHELAHWSGASHRLARNLANRFGDEAYAMEELIAELGATFLCADLGVTNEPRPDHAAYLASWLKVLKQDRRAIFTAAQAAKQAVTYLTGLQPRMSDE